MLQRMVEAEGRQDDCLPEPVLGLGFKVEPPIWYPILSLAILDLLSRSSAGSGLGVRALGFGLLLLFRMQG